MGEILKKKKHKKIYMSFCTNTLISSKAPALPCSLSFFSLKKHTKNAAVIHFKRDRTCRKKCTPTPPTLTAFTTAVPPLPRSGLEPFRRAALAGEEVAVHSLAAEWGFLKTSSRRKWRDLLVLTSTWPTSNPTPTLVFTKKWSRFVSSLVFFFFCENC